MPSTVRNWQLPVAVVALLVLLYAFEVAGNVLFGVFVVAVVYLVAWTIDRLSPGNPLDDMTRERRLATGAVVVVILAYSTVIRGAILLGALVATVVATVSWLTSPIGPVAKWLDGVA